MSTPLPERIWAYTDRHDSKWRSWTDYEPGSHVDMTEAVEYVRSDHDKARREALANSLDAPIQFLIDYIDPQDDPQTAQEFGDEFIEPLKTLQAYLHDPQTAQEFGDEFIEPLKTLQAYLREQP